MNQDQPENQSTPTDLNVNDDSQPVNVPVFNCIVYVTSQSGGGVRARVANLSGIEFRASSEREALAQIIPAFKQRVSEMMQEGAAIPWIEPPAELEPGEQQRFIPVHL